MSEDAALRARLATAENAWKHWQEKAEALEAERDRLREALEWYANPDVYKPHPHGLGFDDRDLSFHARAALSPTPER